LTLPLVPLVDVLLAVVLFELSLFKAPDCTCLRPQIQVPSAENVAQLEESPVVELATGGAFLDGVPIADLAPPLRAKRELWRSLNPGRPFPGRVTLFVDRSVPAGRVKAAMQAATRAGYRQVGFTVRRR
jgi:biopolymer transport protein ExbD